MKCIIVDDEPIALDLISSYVQKTPFLDLLGEFTNPLKAMAFILENELDLLILDINMLELSGLQLINSLPKQPMVIFSTAYPEYGAESYEFDAVDYLLKPVKYDRFLKAITKAHNLYKHEKIKYIPSSPAANKEDTEIIFIKSGTQLHKVKTTEIMYIEASGNYMTFITSTKKIMSLLKIKEVLNMLPNEQFIQIHKSFIIAINHIDMIEKHRVVINKNSLPIGAIYRNQFFEKIEQM